MSAYGYQSGMTLKALLENPHLQNPLLNFNDSEKKDGKESPQYDMGSAFLGPNLWDKTYDMDDFKLEYMDLDEFLSENGIPVAGEEANSQQAHRSVNNSPVATSPKSVPSPPSRVSVPSPPSHMTVSSPPSHLTVASQPSHMTVSALNPPTPVLAAPTPPTPVTLDRVSAPTSPVDDDFSDASESAGEEETRPDFVVSESELALARIPGEDQFDPRKHKFNDNDLKPQPMIKKSKKIFVPDAAKDDRYWCRRKKNIVAAKRSRDARRVKENQIAMRASYLERENTSMKEEVEKLRRENGRLKTALSKYEK